MNKSLLLPREKYEEASRKWGKSPIMMEIENDKQILFYFGANHSRNPDDGQYPILREYWDKFLEKTKSKNCVVLVEGGLRKIIENEDEAILSGSEGNLITLLASKVGVKTESPELTPEKLFSLLDNVSQDEFFLYWFIVWLSGYQRYPNPKPDFMQKLDKWLEHQSNKKDLWNNLDISIDNIKKIYKTVLEDEFSVDIDANKLSDPNIKNNRINEISRLCSDVRDEYVVSEIERHWKLGENIFIVFGNGHLIIQEPALKVILK